jgi:hypothetical protein
MTTFDETSLSGLLTDHARPKVSLLMPVHRVGAEAEQNPIRFEGLLRRAEEELAALDAGRDDISAITDAARRLAKGSTFWRNQHRGLAIFATPEQLRWYRLPIPLEEAVVVDSEFHVAPLVEVARPVGLYVLAVSRGGAQLYHTTVYVMEEVDLPDAPSGLEEITQYYDPEKQLQFRPVARAGRGDLVAMFHGHGIGEGRDKELVLQYLRAIDRSVRRRLNSSASLLVVGPGEVPALYRQVSDHHAVLDRVLELNPDGVRVEELHARALEAAADLFRAPSESAVRRYEELAGTGKASNQIDDVVVAAAQGRIDTLIWEARQHVGGTFDAETSKVETHTSRLSGDVDLVNSAVVHTLRHGGTVVKALPEQEFGSGPVAAIYRF